MSSAMSPGSVDEALEMLQSAMGYLAAADATAMAAEEQARCLRVLERATAVGTAARTSVLCAFTAAQGYSADADYSPRAWLIHKTGVTKATAVAYTAWTRRAAGHRQVFAALTAGELSESYGRTICQWTDKLPEDCRPAADAILLSAARAGMDLRELGGLFAEMYERARSELPDEDPDRDFEDRAVRLVTTFQGAGVLNGDLTPECAAIVDAVLDALSAPAGAEDTRTREQRYHDALQEAMRRLVASDLLPERAGQPVKAWVHMSLADPAPPGRQLRPARAVDRRRSALSGPPTARKRRKAAATAGRGWTATEPRRSRATRRMAPIVTGDLNPAALDNLGPALRRAGPAPPRRRAQPDTTQAWAALEQAIIGQAVDLLSGPGELASFLRRRQLGARLAGPSLPLDIGYAETVPAGIRNAVMLRDQRCRWAGGCNQPASACEVHHTKHKANGGKTSVKDCILLCPFHHQVVIHRWGWTLVLNPDGTTTAWNRDKTKVLHSHGPPVRP